MNTQKFLLTGLLALSLAAVTSHAAVLPGSEIGGVDFSQPGDLVLAFRNPTATADLAVDIGQFTAYEGLAAGVYTIGGYNAADLSAVFGVDAFSANTKWTVFGGTGQNGLSKPDGSLWVTSNSTLTRTNTQGSLSTQFDGFVGAQINSGNSNGLSQDAVKLTNKSFSSLGSGNASPYTAFPVAVENSTLGSTSLQLWELTPGSGPGTLLGTFNFDASGLTFTVSAIPEPSTYAMILGVATLGFAAIRRRKQAQLLA